MIPENIPVFVYTTTPIKLVGEYESTQRALVRLKLKSGSRTYKIVDGYNIDKSRKITYSKTIQRDVFLTKSKL